MSKKIIVGNWKANPESAKDALALLKNIKEFLKRNKKIVLKNHVIVCPPFVYLSEASEMLSKNSVGAQDVFFEKSGAFTGQVTPPMLRSLGVGFSIVGHSEVRKAGDTDEMIAKKISLLLQNGVRPILCVGETERTEKADHWMQIEAMLSSSLSLVKKTDATKLLVAYEPVWAIGTAAKGAMDPADVAESIIFIRKILANHFGQKAAQTIPVLYGGSVDPENASLLVEKGNASGLLIGRQSLSFDSFKKIIMSL